MCIELLGQELVLKLREQQCLGDIRISSLSMTGAQGRLHYRDVFHIPMCSLLQLYPFRLLPPLPPKRLSLSGHHFADAQFLERRSYGLARYAAAVLNHPVLKLEPVVIDFFSRWFCGMSSNK